MMEGNHSAWKGPSSSPPLLSRPTTMDPTLVRDCEPSREPTGFRLFLVEDHDNVALMMRRKLERIGHQVTCCRTAADALIVLSQSNFDLVLLDHELPDMTGLELLHLLEREGINAPILIVTGEGNEQIATQMFQAGALDYIVKDHSLSFLTDLPKRIVESVRRYKLENTNRLLIQALESARDGIMITDLQGTILEVNQALEKMTGYSRQELLGQNPRLLSSGVHPQEFYTRMWQTILARGSWQGELTNRRKDGQLRETSMTISPIVDTQHRLTHFIGIQRDITEHKVIERHLMQIQKMQSIGTLAGGIAHEFNNLMAGINGYASLGLREDKLTPSLKEFLQFIVDLSDRAANLTRQLLAFARKPALIRKRTSLVDMLRSTADLVTRTLHQQVALDIPEDWSDQPRLLVEADANQLQQALINLALNGRDSLLERFQKQQRHTPVPITFRLRHVILAEMRTGFPQQVPCGDYLLIEVEDRGMGMTREVLEQALDPFFTTKEVGHGTGLGLPVVYGIIQGHQGYLTIETAPGKGTNVGLYLPRVQDISIPETTSRVEQYPNIETENAAAHTIVVIDDEHAVLDIVRRFLQIASHKVHCLSSGKEVRQFLGQGESVDLVILDLMMPQDDTTTLFAQIRQKLPDVPVLLCTGLSDQEPVPRLLEQPRTALIRKPFRMSELWYAVKQALELLPDAPELGD